MYCIHPYCIGNAGCYDLYANFTLVSSKATLPDLHKIIRCTWYFMVTETCPVALGKMIDDYLGRQGLSTHPLLLAFRAIEYVTRVACGPRACNKRFTSYNLRYSFRRHSLCIGRRAPHLRLHSLHLLA